MKQKIFVFLTVFYFIPTITDTIKTIIINISQDNISILNIASQIEWFDLINETIMAFLFIPVYFILNGFSKDYKNKYYFKFGIVSLCIYFIFFVITYFKIDFLADFMNFSSPETISYLKLEAVAFLLGVISTYFIYLLIIDNCPKLLFIFCILKLFLTCSLYILSINILGVNGIAWGNIISNIILSVFAIIVGFKRKLFIVQKFNRNDIVWIKTWLKKGVFSGSQILIDNIFYAIMIVRLVNMVNEQGNYWVINNFIWSSLLIPSIALGEIVKDDVHNHETLKFYWPYKVLCIIGFILLITMPFWRLYFTDILNTPNVDMLIDILYKLMPFYIFQMISTILDGKLSGAGKTHYNMISSILINSCYYGGIYLYIISQNIAMTMDCIVYMFGGSMVIHTIFSLIFVIYEIKKPRKILINDLN